MICRKKSHKSIKQMQQEFGIDGPQISHTVKPAKPISFNEWVAHNYTPNGTRNND